MFRSHCGKPVLEDYFNSLDENAKELNQSNKHGKQRRIKEFDFMSHFIGVQSNILICKADNNQNFYLWWFSACVYTKRGPI